MDFGLVGLDNLVCNNPFSSENSYKHKGDGSERFLKQVVVNEDELREFKLGKTTSPFGETMLKIPLQRSHNLSETTPHPQMLCFSSPNSALPSYNRNTVYGSGEMASASFHGVISGIRGPFTPSQWMELEHQALIYKYITANVPIPSYLLNPIRKAMESAGFHAFSGLRSNALGWGAFHLGFSNTDPEPGRCRRTDGKKWRCSRDAVADQKYCERHMNRGRHRSRKPVEGQSGHSPSSKLTTPPPSSTSASVLPASDTLSFSHHNPQLINTLPPASSDNSLSGISNINRTLLKKDNAGGYQHTTNLSMASPRISLKDNQYSVPQPQNAYEESLTQPEFGLVCSDSLLNPLDKSSSLINCRSYVASDSLNGHENKSQHGLRQFMDDWPKSHSERSAISWPDIELHQPDRTQLSISIPTSDYMSSTSSPTNVKLTASPRELEMGLGVGTISWEASMGGPLGEVLHTSNNECKNGTTKALNLIERWDNSSRLVSSPTGVLQRGAFGSLSNSSAGSSPRAESSRMLDGVSLSNGLTAPGPMHHPSFPAL